MGSDSIYFFTYFFPEKRKKKEEEIKEEKKEKNSHFLFMRKEFASARWGERCWGSLGPEEPPPCVSGDNEGPGGAWGWLRAWTPAEVQGTGRPSHGKGSSSPNQDAGKGQDGAAGLGLEPQRCQGLNASARRQRLSAKASGRNFRKFLVWPLLP